MERGGVRRRCQDERRAGLRTIITARSRSVRRTDRRSSLAATAPGSHYVRSSLSRVRTSQVSCSTGAVERIRAARAVVEGIEEEGRQVYGVTTGFGHLSRVNIPRDQLADLQRNLIRSHASGVGEPFDVPTTRAVTLLLANSLARGHSGVRVELRRTAARPAQRRRHARRAEARLGRRERRSRAAGASEPRPDRRGRGDVRGRAHARRARRWSARDLRPIELSAKEGLALINGTHVMEACRRAGDLPTRGGCCARRRSPSR